MLQMAVALVVVAQAIVGGDLGPGMRTPIHPSTPASYPESIAAQMLMHAAPSAICALERH